MEKKSKEILRPYIAIITPVYNRLENIKRVYESLKNQTIPVDQWVIADDGSTDGIKEWVSLHSKEPFPITYVGLGANTGYKQGHARNEGAKNTLEHIDAYLFLDSDVMLYPNVLELYKEAYRSNPDRVICGQYDWGLPIKFDVKDVIPLWDDIINERMPGIPNAEPHGMAGIDIRHQSFEDTEPDDLHWNVPSALSTFGGNILIKKEIFNTPWKNSKNPKKLKLMHDGRQIDTFDTGEEVIGFDGRFTVGIEDGDFGLMTVAKGFPVSLHKGIKGYHIWHPRNIPKIQKISAEQIPLLNAKHGLDVETETDVVQASDYKIK